jgi:hypothetical protein
LKQSKNKNIKDIYRGINVFRKGYQPRPNLVKDDNDNLLADSPSIFEQVEELFVSAT